MRAVHISTSILILGAIAAADPQEVKGIPVRILGSALLHPVATAEQCTGKAGVCVEADESCDGTLTFLHNSCDDRCTCCVPDNNQELTANQEDVETMIHITGPALVSFVPTAEQCTLNDGFCVEDDERCNGTVNFLHGTCNDHCTCCLPHNEGANRNSAIAASQEEGIKVHVTGTALVFAGSSAGKCIKEDGYCIESGEHCHGEVKFLFSSGIDQCTCCVPDNQGANSTSVSAAHQGDDRLRFHITGPALVMSESNVTAAEQCTGGNGFCVEADESCNGKIKFLPSSGNNHCTCCVPDDQVPTAEQCTAKDGFCVEAGETCTGTISFLHNFFDDHCTCCVQEGGAHGCPEGFFTSKGSNQCFKFFNDESRTWDEAKEKCVAEDLLLAKPSDMVAAALRKDLLDKYGKGNVWLDARGDGSKMVWQRDRTELSSDSSLWQPEQPGRHITESNCLGMSVKESSWSRYPKQPYHSAPSCTLKRYALCEKQM